jgi:C-terminal processing protease CtpA/Prc
MGSKNGHIYVTKIRDGSLAALTELQPGMILRTIDNVDLHGMTIVDAANLLANAEGTITVVAEMPSATAQEAVPALITVTVQKNTGEKTGLTLAERGGMLYISQIQKGGLLAGTALSVGMYVMTINNIQCAGLSVKDAAAQLSSIEGDLTILAKKPAVSPGGLMTAFITKQTVDSKVGLRLSSSRGAIVVKGITERSLASETDIKPGMEVVSIGNVPCAGNDVVSAAKMLTDAEGTITIVVASPGAATRPTLASVLLAVTVNVNESSKAGLVLDKKNGITVVSKIDDAGLLFGSGLRPGMEVLKINNVDCAVLSKTSATHLTEHEGMLTILARKTLKRAGVLVAATLKKPTLETKVGLALGKAHDRVVVTKISDGTPAAMTTIQSGMVIRQINGVPINDMSSGDVAQLLGDSVGLIKLLLETPKGDQIGPLSLVKSLVVGAFDNDDEGELGLSLMNNDGKLLVSRVAEDGKCAKSGLRPGMILLSINNTNCSKRTADDAISILEQTPGVVSILAQKPFLGPGEILAVPMNRKGSTNSIGLGLGSSKQTGKIVITNVKEGSLAWFSELYPGMALKSINNQDISGLKPSDAAQILSDATGMLTIAVESMLDFDLSLLEKSRSLVKPATITATVEKEKGGKVGLLLGEKGKKLFISKIMAGGLMSETELKVGMQVISINSVQCNNMAVTDAATILMEAEGAVTIIARQPVLAPGALVTIAVDKGSEDSSVGIGLGVVNGKTVVSSIKYGSPAFRSELQVGMEIKAVSNVDCSKKSPSEVADLFSGASGTILVLAVVPYPPARVIGGGGDRQSRVVYDNNARPPPYGLQEGGVWVRRKYVGETTAIYTAVGCACFILPGIYSIMNPVDIRDVYIYQGKAYTAGGECIGVATVESN